MMCEMYCEFCNKLMGEIYISTGGLAPGNGITRRLAWNCVGCYKGEE